MVFVCLTIKLPLKLLLYLSQGPMLFSAADFTQEQQFYCNATA